MCTWVVPQSDAPEWCRLLWDRSPAQLGDKTGSTEGCVSEGDLSQHSEGSQCDMDVFTSMRRFQPHARPHRAASLPECLRYPPGQRAAQLQQQQLRREDSAAAPPRRSFSSEDSSDMDVDCCGDSGAPLCLCSWICIPGIACLNVIGECWHMQNRVAICCTAKLR